MSADSAAHPAPQRRLRVFMSAYACGPGDEPEAGAGWAFSRAAAADHDVWVVTRRRFEPAITAAMAIEPELAEHLHVTYLELPERIQRLRKRPGSVYWYYALWQRLAARHAAAEHARRPFDLAHHITFAADWLPCGMNRLPDLPLVWGPVGGATYQPWQLARWLGPRGVLGEIARTASTTTARRLFGDPTARRAAIVVAQNRDVAGRFAASRRVVQEANSAFTELPPHRTRVLGDQPVAVFVGRLIPWKGPQLAIAALAEPEVANWRLDIYGSGRERARLEGQVTRLGLAGRVTFKGQRPRSEVLEAVGRADAMIFPSMHDSAPWAVGEASSAGCPVVCLDIGGPPFLAAQNAFAVPVGRAVVPALARELVRAGQADTQPHQRWSVDRLPALLRDWYADAAASVRPAGVSA